MQTPISRIVAEVVNGLLQTDRNSQVHADQAWALRSPTLEHRSRCVTAEVTLGTGG